MARARKSPKMTAGKRKSLPKSSFGLPGSRRFPTDTKGRARSAKAYATKLRRQGKLSKSSEQQVKAKANRKLRG